MTRTPDQAIDWALAQQRGYAGKCLAFVRTAYDIGPRYGSAKAAWENARYRHHTSDINAIPRGVPVFMSHPRSVHGHVVIHLGGGLIRTTNSATGLIHTHHVSTWLGWGYSILGWTEDINGAAIPGAPTIPTAATQATAPRKDDTDMVFVQDNAGNYYMLTDAATQARHLTPEQWSDWAKAGFGVKNPGDPATAGLTREAIGRMAATLGGVR
ncbi:hypothetical protein [Cellulomonas sp. NPDC089187]|uniref:hypothetical protein n=1 Tax=Cellulomonas sp. NPDC089187 TaxID=3154970 RepID=UPI0034275CBD